MGGFRDGADLRPWLLRIVANATRNAQRSSRRRAVRERSPAAVPDTLLPGVSAAAGPAELAVAGERQVRLPRELLLLLRESSAGCWSAATCSTWTRRRPRPCSGWRGASLAVTGR